jgi:hypothetical protein
MRPPKSTLFFEKEAAADTTIGSDYTHTHMQAAAAAAVSAVGRDLQSRGRAHAQCTCTCTCTCMHSSRQTYMQFGAHCARHEVGRQPEYFVEQSGGDAAKVFVAGDDEFGEDLHQTALDQRNHHHHYVAVQQIGAVHGAAAATATATATAQATTSAQAEAAVQPQVLRLHHMHDFEQQIEDGFLQTHMHTTPHHDTHTEEVRAGRGGRWGGGEVRGRARQTDERRAEAGGSSREQSRAEQSGRER